MHCNDTSTTSIHEAPLVVVSALSCSLSVFGAVLIIITYRLIPDIRNTTRKLVTALAVADLLQPLGYLLSIVDRGIIHGDDTGTFCTFQSALTSWASMVSFYLTMMIGFHLFWTVFSQSNKTSSTTFMVTANVISWGIPGIIIAVALSEGMLGKKTSKGTDSNTLIGTGPWCWVKCDNENSEKSEMYMYLTGKAWELQCYVFTAGFYVLVKLQIFLRHRCKKFTLSQISPKLRDDDQNFLYIWLVLLFVRIWGTIRFFLRTLQDKPLDIGKFDSVLVYLQAIGDPSQALVNCILFCILDKKVRYELIARCCGKELFCNKLKGTDDDDECRGLVIEYNETDERADTEIIESRSRRDDTYYNSDNTYYCNAAESDTSRSELTSNSSKLSKQNTVENKKQYHTFSVSTSSKNEPMRRNLSENSGLLSSSLKGHII